MNAALPLTALITASLMWGLAWLPLRGLHRLGVDGVPLTCLAFAAAGAVLAPALLAQRGRWHGEGGFLWLIALLGGYANLTFTVALIYGEVVRVMVLFYLLPVWGVLGGRLFLGERIDSERVLTVVAALLGAMLVLGDVEALAGRMHWTDILAITCGIAFAGNNLVFRARQRLPVASKVAAMLLGAAGIGGLLLVLGLQPWPSLPADGIAWTVVYGVAWLLAATAGTQFGVTHMEAGRASVIIILELVTAVVSATLIGGETMDAHELGGGALILAAAVVEARRAA